MAYKNKRIIPPQFQQKQSTINSTKNINNNNISNNNISNNNNSSSSTKENPEIFTTKSINKSEKKHTQNSKNSIMPIVTAVMLMELLK